MFVYKRTKYATFSQLYKGNTIVQLQNVPTVHYITNHLTLSLLQYAELAFQLICDWYRLTSFEPIDNFSATQITTKKINTVQALVAIEIG